MSRRLAAALLAAVLALGLATPVLAATATTPRASLTDIEYDVMCVACRESLAVAQSPQANAERSFIRMLIAQGESKKQILDALVAQYGTAVLARPPASGFNLTVYILPPAILATGIAILLITLPKWRARSRAAAARPLATGPPLDPQDSRRLDDELARYQG